MKSAPFRHFTPLFQKQEGHILRHRCIKTKNFACQNKKSLTPGAANAGTFPAVAIKDCGNGNTVDGGVFIDTTTDPCF
jgi:hypothetical protein